MGDRPPSQQPDAPFPAAEPASSSLALAVPARNAWPPAAVPGGVAAVDASSRAVVLFVDDDFAVLDALRDALRKQPFEVLCASSALAALTLLETRDVAVLVSDECMPGLSGSELFTLARTRSPRTARILLTGHVTLATTARAKEGGAFGFLTKPCDPHALCAMIADALALRSKPEAASA